MKKLVIVLLLLFSLGAPLFADTAAPSAAPAVSASKGISGAVQELYNSTGIMIMGWKNYIVIAVGLLLIYLAIKKEFEPLLLIPIGIGAIFTNMPLPELTTQLFPDIIAHDPSIPGGFIGLIYTMGIKTGIFPLVIFLGVGALTDFGPMLANPKTILLGAAAQFGIFATLIGALFLGFDLKEASAIGIIGGADGPTSIYTASMLAEHLVGKIAVAAYSYMALVPIIQPPIMRLLTTKKERAIKMTQVTTVPKYIKIIFPLLVILLCAVLIPSAAPLIGMLMLGNLLKESGVVDRLVKAAQNEIINITTIFLGISVGARMQADSFLNFETLGILVLGLIAFSFGTAAGVLFAKVLNKFSKTPINPLIGSAGVSAVPMAARVSQKVGQEENPHNYLLMHAMGPNVAGVIGSAIAAGILIALAPVL